MSSTATLIEAVDEVQLRAASAELFNSRGLADALSAIAARLGLAADVAVGRVGRVPADREEAIYLCCAEALQNVDKHAGPDAEVAVRAGIVDDWLWFEVADDGIGFEVDPREPFSSGGGLEDMANRLAVVGGLMAVGSVPGHGTTVRGELPIR